MHYLQIETLFSDWQAQWVDARLQKVYQHDKYTLSLLLYRGALKGGEVRVLIDFSRSQSVLLTLPQADLMSPEHWDLPRVPVQGFAQALRKHLVGHRLIAMTRQPGDRWVRWVFSQNVTLTLELSGRHSNAFLCDAENVVLAQWRRDHSQRRLVGGMVYSAPLPPRTVFQRPDPLELQRYDRVKRQQLFAAFVLQQRQGFAQRQSVRQCQKALMQAQQRLAAEIHRLEQALEDIEQQGLYQRRGELLQAAFSNPPLPGATVVQVPDYYQPGQPLVDIPLSPGLGLAENIARYYQRARKVERGATYALAHLPALMDQQAQWATHQAALEQWEQELTQGRLLPAKVLEQLRQWTVSPGPHRLNVGGSSEGLSTQEKPRAREGPALHARRFETQEVMWVGKSAKDNHQLTFRYARGTDYWLHVQDSSGSHVLVKASQLTTSLLEEAAHLAAYYSPQRQAFERGEPVAVCYTQVKNVKAIKGGPPGRVQMQRFKTYLVRYREACWKVLKR